MKKLLSASLLLLAAPAWATLSTSMIFEVRQAGSNTNSGCFKEGASGTDYSQQNSAQFTLTDVVIDAGSNTKITSASHNFVSSDVGNCLRISSGTGFTTGVFEIVSVASNAATLDRSAGTLGSTGGHVQIGGALATLAQLNTDMCSGCRAYVKADAAYLVTAKTTFNYSNSGASWIEGFTTTRGDNGMPTIKANSAFGDRIIDLNVGSNFTFRNFKLDVNSQGSGTSCMLIAAAQVYVENWECTGFTSGTQLTFSNVRIQCRYCYIHDGTSTSAIVNYTNDDDICFYCTLRAIAGNGAIGFQMQRGHCYYCVVDSLTGTTTDGFQTTNQGPWTIDHCVVYNVTRDAIRITAVTVPMNVTNCIFSTASNGINNSSGTTLRAGDILNDYNFTYNVSGSAVSGLTAGGHSATLTADPFVAASSHNFSLNNTTNGGAKVRAKGYQANPGITGTSYIDAGVVQHQDPKFRLFY